MATTTSARTRPPTRGLVLVAAMLGVLGLATPAFAGDDSAGDGDDRGPRQGVTYAGRDGGLSVRLTAMGPMADGRTQASVHLRLRCGDGRRPQVDEELSAIVEADGSYDIEKEIHEVGGGTFDVEIDVEGSFTGGRSTTAEFSYDLYDEDDDGNVTSCDDEGDLELEGGRPSPGLQRVEAAIPIEVEGDDADGGPIAATADAVFAAIGQTDSAGGDATDLYRIDPATNEVTAHQSVPIDLNALVVAGSSLFGIDADHGTLVPIDTDSLTPGPPIQVAPPRQVPPDEDWALWPAGAVLDGAIWLSATRDSQVVRVDPSTGSVVARFPMEAHPTELVAGPGGLYVETQTTPLFSAPVGTIPETNVIRRIDPTTGATLATTSEYRDGTVSGCVAGPDGVVCSMIDIASSSPDRLASFDPETLEEGATAPLQYPLAAAPPGVWTESARNQLTGLRGDLTREVVVPGVITSDSGAGVGFDAIWVYNADQRTVYRVSTAGLTSSVRPAAPG